MLRLRIAALPMALLAAGLTTTDASAAQTRCARGLYAGAHTSCGIAKALFAKIGRDDEKIGDGIRIPVKSPVNGKVYKFYLYRGDDKSFTCRADAAHPLSVRIDNA